MTEDLGTSVSTRRPAPMIVKTFTPENGAKVFVIMENLPGECRHRPAATAAAGSATVPP
jgi:hypothetical protein